jgi:DNA-binding beta-propeller fold protein YncE
MRRLSILFALSAAFGALAGAGTLYLPAYPAKVLVFDEGQGKVVDSIPLSTGTPMSIRLSGDHKTIYVTTIDHNGIEVIDVASRKVTNHFELNTPTTQYRFFTSAADPQGKFLYAVTKEITKSTDHFEVSKPKYTLIDLAQQKIVKMVDIPKEEEANNEGDFGAGQMDVSPDGRYIYQFGEKITILDASDFKVVDHIDLSRPDAPGMENVHFGGDLDLINEPGEHTALFVSSDPIVHNHVFGLARFDLNNKHMDFSPIGPAPPGMAGIEVTPDKKWAYTVVASGIHGTKRCEFWRFDLTSDKITNQAEVPCRTRFTLGISADGQKLYIYGAGFQIEVYDAATLKYEKTWDLNNDVTYAGIVVLP